MLVVKRNVRVNGFCYGAGHRIGEAIAIATCERRTSFPGTRGAACKGIPQGKGGKICTRAGTQAPVPRSVRARQRECKATGVRQTHARTRTQKRPAPYAVSSSSARLQQGHVGRVGRGTASVAVPVCQHLAEHGSSCSAVFQFPLRLLQPRGESESEGAGGGRKESGAGRPARRGRRLGCRLVVW